jgi:drug/metabolite transporter (DMT)-like permease
MCTQESSLVTPPSNLIGRRWMAYACLALSMSLVGSYVALSKPLVAAFPVFLLAWLRFGIGGLAMAHWLRKPADEPRMTSQTRMLVFLESFLGNFLFSICMLFGVSMTSAVSAGVIMAAIPAVVAVLSWLFLGESVSRRTWAAVGCAAAGIALLAVAQPVHGAGGANNPPASAWLGNLLVFGAVLCEAAYAVIGKQLTGVLGPPPHHSTDQSLGLCPGHAIRVVCGDPFRLFRCRCFPSGCCWCFTHWQRASGQFGCG